MEHHQPKKSCIKCNEPRLNDNIYCAKHVDESQFFVARNYELKITKRHKCSKLSQKYVVYLIKGQSGDLLHFHGNFFAANELVLAPSSLNKLQDGDKFVIKFSSPLVGSYVPNNILEPVHEEVKQDVLYHWEKFGEQESSCVNYFRVPQDIALPQETLELFYRSDFPSFIQHVEAIPFANRSAELNNLLMCAYNEIGSHGNVEQLYAQLISAKLHPRDLVIATNNYCHYKRTTGHYEDALQLTSHILAYGYTQRDVYVFVLGLGSMGTLLKAMDKPDLGRCLLQMLLEMCKYTLYNDREGVAFYFDEFKQSGLMEHVVREWKFRSELGLVAKGYPKSCGIALQINKSLEHVLSNFDANLDDLLIMGAFKDVSAWTYFITNAFINLVLTDLLMEPESQSTKERLHKLQKFCPVTSKPSVIANVAAVSALLDPNISKEQALKMAMENHNPVQVVMAHSTLALDFVIQKEWNEVIRLASEGVKIVEKAWQNKSFSKQLRIQLWEIYGKLYELLVYAYAKMEDPTMAFKYAELLYGQVSGDNIGFGRGSLLDQTEIIQKNKTLVVKFVAVLDLVIIFIITPVEVKMKTYNVDSSKISQEINHLITSFDEELIKIKEDEHLKTLMAEHKFEELKKQPIFCQVDEDIQVTLHYFWKLLLLMTDISSLA